MNKQAEDRFWRKVNKDGECWNWTAHKITAGYGHFRMNGKTWLAHRVAWEFTRGQKIPKGMLICHTCDNPSCCNPDHLWMGTQKDNMRDMVCKGRRVSPCGDGHPNTYRSDALVREVVKDHNQSGRSMSATSRKYGVARGTLIRWVQGRHRQSAFAIGESH